MDPITLAIVTALAAGVGKGVGTVAETTIGVAYAALKAAIHRKFGGDSAVAKAVADLEAKPDSEGRKATLEEEVAAGKADQDPEVLKAAQELVGQIKARYGNVLIEDAEAGGSVRAANRTGGDTTVRRVRAVTGDVTAESSLPSSDPDPKPRPPA